jgi:hypothetical protein
MVGTVDILVTLEARPADDELIGRDPRLGRVSGLDVALLADPWRGEL